MTSYKDVPNKVQDYVMYAHLIVIDMTVYDVILRMDWLSTHHAVINCQKKRVRFQPLKAKSFKFQGTPRKRAVLTILAMKTRKLLSS